MSDTIESFAAMLRAERARVDMPQKQLADLVQTDPSVVSRWESGNRKRPPHRDTIAVIETVLGVTDGRLLAAAGFTIHRSGTASIGVESSTSAEGEREGGESLSYGGTPLTAEEERDVLDYIGLVKRRRDRQI